MKYSCKTVEDAQLFSNRVDILHFELVELRRRLVLRELLNAPDELVLPTVLINEFLNVVVVANRYWLWAVSVPSMRHRRTSCAISTVKPLLKRFRVR